jgi:predicted enzyme related to lactoylglutathione lyase
MDRSIAFYTTAFDLQVTGTLSKMKRAPVNGETEEIDIKLSILKFPGQKFVLEIGERSNFISNNSASNFTHLGVDVADIEAASERIIKAGGKKIRPITLVETDAVVAKNVFFAGPDGETIELMQIIKGEF